VAMLKFWLRPSAPPLAVGILVCAVTIAVETLVMVLLKRVAPGEAFGTIYLLGVLLVSSVWGLGLSVAMSLASAFAFGFCHDWPRLGFSLLSLQTPVIVAVFLVTALCTNFVTGLARGRAVEADQRRREADLSANLAHVMLRAGDLQTALDVAGQDLAAAVGLRFAALELGEVASDANRYALPLHDGAKRLGTLLVHADLPESNKRRLKARVVPALEALLRAALERERVHSDLTLSRGRLAALAEQQAGLRRVATLVARGASPTEVFSAVADEMARCLDAHNASVNRFDGEEVVVLALSRLDPGIKDKPVVGEHYPLEGDNIATRVLRTGRPARLDSLELQNAPGPIAARLREMGFRSTAAVPIIVDGVLWGVAVIGSTSHDRMPPDTEARMGDFADLVATAIANAATRSELIASRARIVAAGDEARRRLERNLHDGAQQRLVALGLQLRTAEDALPDEMAQQKRQLMEVLNGITEVSQDLQEISRGIHPAVLSKGGLAPALKILARRSAVPVNLDLGIRRRFTDPVEVASYYVVAEALTNAAKHAGASEVTVSARNDDDHLYLSIRDDGIGGADARKGSGLIGIKDRIEALGGQIEVISPPGTGTSLHITIPVGA
jgi:signal transduction histidine kinase